MNRSQTRFKGYRYTKEIIGYTVWLYHHFLLSLRDISELLLEWGIPVSHESIRGWNLKFGRIVANTLKRRAPRRGDKWHLDEICLVINKQKQWLWRAVDQEGYELDILLQKKRNSVAAKRFFKKLLKGLQYVPRVLVTDKPRSYAAAKNEIISSVEHRQHKKLNNRAENSHQATRQQEKKMQKFKSSKQAQRFLTVHGQVRNLYLGSRYKQSANDCREHLKKAFACWQQIILQASCA